MVLRIFKTIATSGFLTACECTKFIFGRGCAPDPTGAYSAPPDTLAGLRGLTSKGKGSGWREKRKRGREEEGKGRDRPPFRKFLDLFLVYMN